MATQMQHMAQCPCGMVGDAEPVGTHVTFRDRTFDVTSPDNGETHRVTWTWTEEDGRSRGVCHETGRRT